VLGVHHGELNLCSETAGRSRPPVVLQGLVIIAFQIALLLLFRPLFHS